MNPDLQGMPVLTEITAPDGKKTTVRVQAISREPIADSEFPTATAKWRSRRSPACRRDDKFFKKARNLARGLLYCLLFWGEQQAVVALVTAACTFSGEE